MPVTVPPKSMVWFSSPPGEWTKCDFSLKVNGHVQCENCGSIWCVHTELAVKKRWDAKAIWEWATDELPGQLNLEIPMFPTDNFWTPVILTKDNRFNRYAVEWDHAPGKIDRTVFLTYINPGEGRALIREVLMDFMWADPDRTKECKAAHHGVPAQYQWERDIHSNRLSVASWCVYMNQQCIHCLTNTGLDPDLIPGREGNVWSKDV